MSKHRRGDDRDELLADVAEMYYEESLTQAQISRSVGVTRSAISRMLTEAREKGIVDIRIRRPLRYNAELGAALMQHFGLRSAYVVSWKNAAHDDDLRDRLGRAAAQVLATMLTPGATVGVAWGTTVSATIDAFDLADPVPVTVVQLVGVLGSSSHAYNAQALVERLARKTGGEGVYLYTPFIVENADTARSLLAMPNVQQAIETGRHADIALLGIGSTQPELSSLYLGGHISLENLRALCAAGAVGDVSGHHFDINGHTPDLEFHRRLVGIAQDDLLRVPARLAVAGSPAKAEAILGALRAGYVTILVTDSLAAARVLELIGVAVSG